MPKIFDVDAGVDVIISVQVRKESIVLTQERYASLLRTLRNGGLRAVGRRGDSDAQILVFVSCPEAFLRVLVHKERKSDFLSGLPVIPIPDHTILPSERIRLVHSYITSANSDGGLGIHPDIPRWDLIQTVFCLHDRVFNELWVHSWASNWLSTASVPQEQIRAHFGDAFSLYFIFIQSYTRALAVPAAFGVIFWGIGAPYSPIYSLLTSVWGIGFVEWWRVKERRIALRYGVRGSTRVEKARVQNRYKDISTWTREIRILASVPVILSFAVLLAVLMTGIFFLEEFCEHFYTGPGRNYVTFTPTIIYAILVPHLISFFQSCAERFATWENHTHHSTHDASVTLKTFIFTALVAYLSLTLTALVYVPFGDAMVAVALKWFGRNTSGTFDSIVYEGRTHLMLDRSRLEEQMFAYTVTNQIVDSASEIGWPYAMKIWHIILELIWRKQSDNLLSEELCESPTMESPPDSPISPFRESAIPQTPKSPFATAFAHLRSFSTSLSLQRSAEDSLLTRALHESTLPSTPSNLSTDYSEMVIQFGYIVLWSTIFPLAPFFALLNNVLEMRKDAFRIANHERRPIPERTESIGPWLDVLEFLGWGSAIVNVILVGLFCPSSQTDERGKCGYLFDLTEDTGTPIEMISIALSDAVWDSADAAAWRELAFTVLLLVLGASQAWVVVRGLMRHIIEKVMWEGSTEVENWRNEMKRVKTGFLDGLSDEGVLSHANVSGESSNLHKAQTEKEKIKPNKRRSERKRKSLLTRDEEDLQQAPNLQLDSPDIFWTYDEGLEEIRRLSGKEE
ncbi:calcium-activated chloride channel-domain-containing protein [Lentinula edodes]|uniref:calcium-activated chloride channel-domain-containing protein n=1 Tax=Lentinula edodes TaxID=5353 RepID=UPI001E8DE9F4|nr:calcium-activated chloride channel-domain-containing protein [Lentinula edodes]KAH7872372.1 calcium-activated chloride channel-domain-containing protein [Lentinula edodes]